MITTENLLKTMKPLTIILIFIYMIGGHIVATTEQYSNFIYWLTVIGVGIGGLIMGKGILEKKLRTVWFSIAATLLGIITGKLIGNSERMIEWSIVNSFLGTMIGYESYNGWRKIVIGATIGLVVAILAGTQVSFDGFTIEDKVIHVTISMLTGILIGSFWGSVFPSKIKEEDT